MNVNSVLYPVALFALITNLSSNMLNCMQHNNSTVQGIRAHFYIGTSEYNNKKSPPYNADNEHNAIREDVITQLYDNNTDHIFITYNLLTSLKKSYNKSCEYFANKNIQDPLQQIMIEPMNHTTYYTRGKSKGVLGTKRVTFFNHLSTQGEKTLTSDNYHSHILKKKYGTGLINYFKLIIGLQKWGWHDTGLGLYLLTQKKDTPFRMNNFSKIEDPLATEAKLDSNEWVENLDSIFITDDQANHNNHWAIHIAGHGTMREKGFKCITAGLSEHHIAEFFKFFNSKIPTDLVSVQSCYTRAQRILKLVQKQKGNTSQHFDYPIITCLADESKVSSSYGPSGIDSYYPPWLNKEPNFQATQTFLIPNLLKKIQEEDIAANTDSLIKFLKTYPFFPNPSLLPAYASEQIEIIADPDAYFPKPAY